MISVHAARLVLPTVLIGALASGCGSEQKRRQVTQAQPFVCPAPGKAVNPAVLDTSMQEDMWAILADDNRRSCWGAVLTAIGYLNTGDAFIRLRSFIEGRGAVLALSEDLIMLQLAFMSLGNIVRQGTHQKNADLSLDYLLWSTDPVNWEKRVTDWRLDAVMRRELVRTLTTSAVKALGATRHEEARQHLLQMALDSADRRSFRSKYQLGATAKVATTQLINLHVLPPGRVAFATNAVLKQLGAAEERNLVPEVEKVRERAMATYALEQEWLESRRSRADYLRRVREMDKIADARLSGLHGQFQSLRHLLDAPVDQAAINQVEKVIFPEGPLMLINAPVLDQVNRALAALAVLQERFAKELVRLKLESHVSTAREAHEALYTALKKGMGGPGYEKIIERRSELQVALRVMVAKVIARYPGYALSESARRDEVLGPVMDQNEQVSNYLRRLVQVRDIEPTTGQELSPMVDEGTAAGAGVGAPRPR